jgi:hypothetical protein
MSLLALGDAPLRPTDRRPHVKILPVMRCFGKSSDAKFEEGASRFWSVSFLMCRI